MEYWWSSMAYGLEFLISSRGPKALKAPQQEKHIGFVAITMDFHISVPIHVWYLYLHIYIYIYIRFSWHNCRFSWKPSGGTRPPLKIPEPFQAWLILIQCNYSLRQVGPTKDIFLVLVGLVEMATSGTISANGESSVQRLIRALKAFRCFRMIRPTSCFQRWGREKTVMFQESDWMN